jgi:hypothetical protein
VNPRGADVGFSHGLLDLSQRLIVIRSGVIVLPSGQVNVTYVPQNRTNPDTRLAIDRYQHLGKLTFGPSCPERLAGGLA